MSPRAPRSGLWMNAVPALVLLLWRKRFQMTLAQMRLWQWFAFISLGLLALFYVTPYSTAIDRMALYMLPLQLAVFSYVPEVFGGQRSARNTPFVLAVLAYYAAVLFVWLNFAAHSFAWIPYRFYPLEAWLVSGRLWRQGIAARRRCRVVCAAPEWRQGIAALRRVGNRGMRWPPVVGRHSHADGRGMTRHRWFARPRNGGKGLPPYGKAAPMVCRTPYFRRSAFPCRRDGTAVVPETAQPPQCRHPGNRAAVIRDPRGARATHGGWCQLRPSWIPGLRCAPPGMTGLMGMPSSRKPRSGYPGSTRGPGNARRLVPIPAQLDPGSPLCSARDDGTDGGMPSSRKPRSWRLSGIHTGGIYGESIALRAASARKPERVMCRAFAVSSIRRTRDSGRLTLSRTAREPIRERSMSTSIQTPPSW
jgi:hypothetical protein